MERQDRLLALQFTLVVYERYGETYTINRWGTKRTDFPALNELKHALDNLGIDRCEVLCEVYAVEGERMLVLPQLIHILKGGGDLNKVRIGVWDIAKINNIKPNNSYLWRLQEAEEWFRGCERVHVLPYILAKSHQEIQAFWDKWVVGRGYEGLMIRARYDSFKVKGGGFSMQSRYNIFKVKPFDSVDCVIIGINKRPEFHKQKVTSLKLALMNSEGKFVELGDVASGISHPLRDRLWKLMDLKIGEDSNTVWVKPLVVVEVEYNHTFNAKKRLLDITESGILQIGTVDGYSLRSPRLKGFRKDKRVNPDDLRLTQLA